MPKPVEIEFLMKDNLTPGMDKAGQSAESLSQKAKAAAEAINAKIAEQRKVVDSVSADLVRLESQLTKLKPGKAQTELAADVKACRKVLDEERNALANLENEHKQAEQAVSKLAKEEKSLGNASRESVLGQTDLTKAIAEQKQRVKEAEIEVRNLEKAWRAAAPGNAQNAALQELNSARLLLKEEREDLDELTTAQERFKNSNQRLSMQLRTLQDAMAKMRIEGKQDTDEYRAMAEEAAKLSDTIADLRTQTRILSNDDANLQGFMSGINGVSGAFTAATGAVSLFASENENLAKIQARVQSVMAITMGLQQVFNTLNKDSAFRLVTVVKMKNLLTAANARLATSLGVSTVAAQALMATLTLGLSAVITGLIVAWDKYSEAQEEAAEKVKERIEIESEGRAQMIKTRFELENTIKEIKNFNGTKDEEKAKVEELNRKYGETFGYCDSLAQWYDVLIQKSSDYINMLFLQAKAQALVNKAVEADKEVAEIKATPDDEVDGAHGGVYRFFARMGAAQSRGQISMKDVDDSIDKHNKEAKEAAVKAAEAKRDAYLEEAKALTEQQAQIGKDSHIGGFKKPDSPKSSGNSSNSTSSNKGNEQKEHEELLSLRRKNQREEIELMEEGKRKKIEQVKQEYNETIAEIEKQEAKWKKEQKGTLTDEQVSELNKARKNAEDKKSNGLNEIEADSMKAQVEAMQEYLKQYGTMQEQRLAIAEEYAKKIEEVNKGEGTAEEKKWKIKTLEKERNASLSKADANNLAMSIDWGSAFEGVGNVLKDVAKETLSKVESYMKTPEFKNLSATDKRNYYDLQEKLKQETGGTSSSPFNFKIWGTISKNVTAYQDSVRTLATRTDEHTRAVAELEEAQAQLAAATDESSKAIAKVAVDTAQGKVDITGAAQTEAQAASDKAKQTLTDNTNAAAQGIKNFTGYLNEMSNGSLYGFANGITKLITSLGKGSDGVGKALGELGGKIGGIIGAILQILDALGDDPKGFIDDLLNKVATVVETIIAELPKIILTIIKDVGNIIGGVFNGIASWFGVDDLFGVTGNKKEVQETIDKLTKRSELLQRSIEDLTDAMNSSYGKKSTDAYEQAKKNQEENNQTYLEKAQAQASYHSSHHSWNYYWNGFTGSQTDWIKNNVNNGFDGNIWGLTPEEMRKLLSNEDIYNYITNTGKGGYGDRVMEYLEEYAEQAGKIEELTDQWRENITQISFDSMKDSFLSNLMDMSKSADDFADDFAENMQKALLSYSMEDLINGDLKKLYDEWADMIDKKDGMLDETDIEAFNKRYDDIVAEGLRRRDNWAQMTGYDETNKTSQSGKSGSFNALSQEQGTKLEGLFTSGQMHWANMDSNIEIVTASMSAAETHLAKIEEHTGQSAINLNDIKEDIKKIIRDGLKVK